MAREDHHATIHPSDATPHLNLVPNLLQYQLRGMGSSTAPFGCPGLQPCRVAIHLSKRSRRLAVPSPADYTQARSQDCKLQGCKTTPTDSTHPPARVNDGAVVVAKRLTQPHITSHHISYVTTHHTTPHRITNPHPRMDICTTQRSAAPRRLTQPAQARSATLVAPPMHPPPPLPTNALVAVPRPVDTARWPIRLRLRAQGSGLRAQGSGLRAQGSGGQTKTSLDPCAERMGAERMGAERMDTSLSQRAEDSRRLTRNGARTGEWRCKVLDWWGPGVRRCEDVRM
jgi:hypothetical protein